MTGARSRQTTCPLHQTTSGAHLTPYGDECRSIGGGGASAHQQQRHIHPGNQLQGRPAQYGFAARTDMLASQRR